MAKRIAALLLLCAACDGGGRDPRLAFAFGEPANPDSVASWDTAIAPDGVGLPAGSGDSRDGGRLYERHCLACHGAGGVGGPAGDLVGGQGSVGGPTPKRTVGSYWPYATTLFDYIRRAMPYDRPGSLTDEEVYALTAFLLTKNGILDEGAPVDAKSLAEIVMPNRAGFPPSRAP